MEGSITLESRPPFDLWSLTDLQTPWCIHVAVTLDIPAFTATEPRTIDQIAHHSASDPEMLTSVLRHLVAKGVFIEPEKGLFELSPAAMALAEPAARLGLDLNGIGGRMACAWETLLPAVRSGKPAYADRFGLPFWEDLEAHPEIASQFDEMIGPSGHGAPDSEILIDGNWDGVRHVVDIGGGTGALLAAILTAHPTARGTLVDLPRTIQRAAKLLTTANVLDRVTLVPGSFFDPLPLDGDLYILKSILNDWPDLEALSILCRCREASGPSSRVVVIGGVSIGPHAGALSIEGVLLGGRDRTLTDFQTLTDQAGFKIARTGNQPSGRFVVELRPVEARDQAS